MYNLEDRITPNFKLKEFFQHTAVDKWCVGYFRQNEGQFYPRFYTLCSQVLEPLRAAFGGRPVLITSGLRSPVHNRAVGGARFSRHLTAEAVDLYIAGVPLDKVHGYLKTLSKVGGLALGPSFVHVDIRPRVYGQIVTWRY